MCTSGNRAQTPVAGVVSSSATVVASVLHTFNYQTGSRRLALKSVYKPQDPCALDKTEEHGGTHTTLWRRFVLVFTANDAKLLQNT